MPVDDGLAFAMVTNPPGETPLYLNHVTPGSGQTKGKLYYNVPTDFPFVEVPP